MRLSWRLKLTFAYTGAFAVTLIVGVILVWFAARAGIEGTVDATLRETANLTRLTLAQGGRPSALPSNVSVSRDTVVELLDARGRVLQALGASRAPKVPLAQGFQQSASQRGYTLAINVPGGRYIRVSRPLDASRDILDGFAQLLLLATGVLLVIAGISGYLLAGRALTPVREVVRTARRITSSGAYTERVRPLQGQDEMAELVGTVNGLLDRVQGTIDRERSFARSAAHELRTPLTALRGRLELTLARPREQEEYRQGLLGMQGSVDQLLTLTGRLLSLSGSDRSESHGFSEAGIITFEAVEALQPEAKRLGKRLDVEVSPCWVQADAVDLRQVVTNLVENALKHGPPAGAVQVSLTADRLSVRDPGHGPDRDEWTRLLQPFERGGRDDQPGSGLGLALVAALSERWGTLQPEWSPDGFTVHLRWAARLDNPAFDSISKESTP